MPTDNRTPLLLLIERILTIVTVLGLICLGIGLPLYALGRISNDFTVARIGAYILLVGIVLTALRIFYWIAEQMVGRGLESMANKVPF